MLPSPNQANVDTNNEMVDKNKIKEISSYHVSQIAGTVEILTSKWLPNLKTRQLTKPDKLSLRKNQENFPPGVGVLEDEKLLLGSS